MVHALILSSILSQPVTFIFWWKDFMKDYRRLRSGHVLLHITEIESRDKLRHNFFIGQKFLPCGGAFT